MKHIKKYNEYKLRDTIDLSIIEDYLLKIRDRGFPIEFEADYVDHLYITIEFSEERRNENFYKSIDEFVEENKNIWQQFEFIGKQELFYTDQYVAVLDLTNEWVSGFIESLHYPIVEF